MSHATNGGETDIGNASWCYVQDGAAHGLFGMHFSPLRLGSGLRTKCRSMRRINTTSDSLEVQRDFYGLVGVQMGIPVGATFSVATDQNW